eukprot:scaffold153830_cov35-Tisochrysis_lutea.AAC.7
MRPSARASAAHLGGTAVVDRPTRRIPSCTPPHTRAPAPQRRAAECPPPPRAASHGDHRRLPAAWTIAVSQQDAFSSSPPLGARLVLASAWQSGPTRGSASGGRRAVRRPRRSGVQQRERNKRFNFTAEAPK